MPIASEPEIAYLDRMRSHISDQSRANQKTIAVILHAAPVVVVMQTALNCVALPDQILTEHVSDVDILMAGVETVQTAIGVLLQHGKVSGVELDPIVVSRAEETKAKIVIRKNEPAKVRNEWLNTGAHGDEIIVCIHVPEFYFGERLLKRNVRIGAIST